MQGGREEVSSTLSKLPLNMKIAPHIILLTLAFVCVWFSLYFVYYPYLCPVLVSPKFIRVKYNLNSCAIFNIDTHVNVLRESAN